MKIPVPTLLHAVECLSLDGFHLGELQWRVHSRRFLFWTGWNKDWYESTFFWIFFFFFFSHLSNCHSCPNAIHTQVFSVSLSLTMRGSTITMRFLSLLIGSVSVSNIFPLTHSISTPSRKHFPKSSTSWGSTRTTTERGQVIVFCLICMRY